MQRSSQGLTEEQTMKLQKWPYLYADIFSTGDLDVGHRLDTSSSRPINHSPKRIAPVQRRQMEQTVSEVVAQELVEKSNSSWSSAVVLFKKDGSQRLCVVYRAFNSHHQGCIFSQMCGWHIRLVDTRWFSTLDLKSGFHQVQMSGVEKYKTVFSFGQGV